MVYFKLMVCITFIFILSAIYCMNIHAMSRNELPKIIINLPSYTLGYYENNELIKEYPIAIGKPSTPTPVGLYTIQDKEVNPAWYPPDKRGYIVPSGPGNPLGYRWMGFESNYGIHGTNAPWSIGTAISNGCIRMYEEDIEQLFDKIQYNTSVSIIYDRINVQIDQGGNATIKIFPDVYGYKNITLEDVKYKLVAEHVGNLIEDDLLIKVIMDGKRDRILFAKVSNIKINNKELEEYLVWWEGLLYAPVEKIGIYLGITSQWDEKSQSIVSPYNTVPGMVKNNILYVEAPYLSQLFGVQEKWDQYNNCLLIDAPALFIFGQFVTHNIQIIEGMPYVPIDKIAGFLGRKIYWDKESKSLWLGSRKIPSKQLGDDIYIEANKISDYFNISIVYNETLKTVNMTEFCCAIDYSMYLGEMEDFID